jgi:polyphosphate kinase
LSTSSYKLNSGKIIWNRKKNLSGRSKKLTNKIYKRELKKLQIELVKLQEWIKKKELKVVVIFEGRDAAGKGGVIKRITQVLNPQHMQGSSLRHTY